MTEKMKYINIMGFINDVDRIIDEYISKFDIHLEVATKNSQGGKKLTTLDALNPYTDIMKKAEKIIKLTGRELRDSTPLDMTIGNAIEVIETASDYVDNIASELNQMKKIHSELYEIFEIYQPFLNLEIELSSLSDFSFIKYQFGKMPIASFKQFEAFLYKDPEILFVDVKRDAHFMWGVYLTADYLKDKIDSVFTSLHFDKIDIPLSYNNELFYGTPYAISLELEKRLAKLDEDIAKQQHKLVQNIEDDEANRIDIDSIKKAYAKISDTAFYFDARKYAVKTSNDFVLFVGWMTAKDSGILEEKITKDETVVFITQEDNEGINTAPPTKLTNPRIFRPFEFFVRMYGLPAYGEMDPTIFVAITYSLLFGFMFGDMGQGAVISLAGIYMYKKKKLKLGLIMGVIGLFSMFFGLMFGSVFGFEFGGLWMHPPNEVSYVLIISVAFGIFLIFMTMLFNIANNIKKHDIKKAVFSQNGVFGFLFYLSVLLAAYFGFIENIKISIIIIILFIIIPILLMIFKDPIMALIRKEEKLIHGKLGLFLFEAFIDGFEIVLSYFTNTVSFVRVGAFVLSHASIMSVVMLLAEKASGASVVVVIIGNIFVLALEGLIVGIQVLRLQFYEMFSRFYDGSGHEFVPYSSLKRQ